MMCMAYVTDIIANILRIHRYPLAQTPDVCEHLINIKILECWHIFRWKYGKVLQDDDNDDDGVGTNMHAAP